MDSIIKNLSPEFKEEFKEQKVNISTAYELSTLPEEAQQEVFEEFKQSGNISIDDVKEKKAEIKTGIEEAAERKEETEPTKEEETPEPPKETEATEYREVPAEPRKERPQFTPKPEPFPTIYEILKGMSISELAEFFCYRCSGTGNFCDLTIKCNQSKENERHRICVEWLKTQAQKRG